MLVLSRRIGEAIVLPDSGATVTVVQVSGRRVKLGVTAPSGVCVLREEIVDHDRHASPGSVHPNRPEKPR